MSLLADAHNAMRCVLDQLRFLLLQDPRWRRPLVCGFGDDARDAQTRAQVAELLGALPEVMRRLSPDDVLGARTLVGLRPQTVSPASRFLRAPHTRVEIGAPGAGGAVLVKFVAAVTRRLGRTVRGVEMTPGGVSLLRWIEARDAAFAAGDLAAAFPDQPFAAVKQVLELCVQAQFVRSLMDANRSIADFHVDAAGRNPRQRAYQLMVEKVEEAVGYLGKIKVAYVHAAAPQEVDKIRLLVEDRLTCVETLVAELTPALGVHTGPGTAGLCFFPISALDK